MRERLTALASLDGLDALPDFYATGAPVRRLEEKVAALLGTEDAVFFPTGTMAQQVALRYGAELTGRSAVALHPLSHLERHERNAFTQLTGLRGLWPTTDPRQPTGAELAALGEPFGTLLVELPMRDAGFLLPSWDELVSLTAAARAAGARVHFDGARLWESTHHLGRSLDEVSALADSVYVSFYKTLGGLSGAALAGTADLAAYARAWRHRHGGNVFQQWPAALTALHGLETELPGSPRIWRKPPRSPRPSPPSPVPGSTPTPAHPALPTLAPPPGRSPQRGRADPGRAGAHLVHRPVAGHPRPRPGDVRSHHRHPRVGLDPGTGPRHRRTLPHPRGQARAIGRPAHPPDVADRRQAQVRYVSSARHRRGHTRAQQECQGPL